MAEEKTPQKVIMIVNGQPIEVCLKTLILSNQRAQNVLKTIKKESMQGMHTLRFFWGDVMMLNIITNHLLQKIDSKSLARMLKPVNSLEEDWKEYYEEHARKTETLKNALIKAFDSSLPLDYSSELEKYYKDEYLNKDKKEDNDFKDAVKEINSSEHQNSNKSKNASHKKDDIEKSSETENDAQSPKETLPKSEKSNQPKSESKTNKETTTNKTMTSKQKRATYKTDEDEETIDFLSLLGGPIKSDDDDDDKQTIPIENFILDNTTELSKNPILDKNKTQKKQTEYSAAKEAFTSYDSLDLDKLFS